MCVCDWWEKKKKKNGLGKTAQPEKKTEAPGELRERRLDEWGEERGLTDQPERRKGGKEGERNDGNGPDPPRPACRPAHPHPNSDQITFIFPANCFIQTSLGNHHIPLLFIFHPKIQGILENFLGFIKPNHGYRKLRVQNPVPFLKQFLQLLPSHSFLLRPRTKPKQVMERRSCFGDGLKTPKT